MTHRITLNKLEFYITNVCNLTCSNCNRYNNYKFAGHWRWAYAEPVLAEWAKKIQINQLVVLGGEPLLNPDIVEWVTGLSKLWPRSEGSAVQIQTNGSRLDLVQGLYEAIGTSNWIGVSLHAQEHKDILFSRIRNFLRHPIVETEDPSHFVGSRWQFFDAGGRKLHVWDNSVFGTSNIIEKENGKFGLYNSNPDLAHENCTFRKFKNYHMIRGKIYKCGPVALMSEFDEQYPFDISDEDRALIHAPNRGLAVEDFDQQGRDFFANIDRVIPQCRFCPESYEYRPITFSRLKPNKI